MINYKSYLIFLFASLAVSIGLQMILPFPYGLGAALALFIAFPLILRRRMMSRMRGGFGGGSSSSGGSGGFGGGLFGGVTLERYLNGQNYPKELLMMRKKIWRF